MRTVVQCRICDRMCTPYLFGAALETKDGTYWYPTRICRQCGDVFVSMIEQGELTVGRNVVKQARMIMFG